MENFVLKKYFFSANNDDVEYLFYPLSFLYLFFEIFVQS